MTTTYFYDTDADSTAPHKANRLMLEVAHGDPDLDDFWPGTFDRDFKKTYYEYALDGEAVGNVTRIIRKEQAESFSPNSYTVYSYCFAYNRAGELWNVATQWWREDSREDLDPTYPPQLVHVREFRGSGQSRHILCVQFGLCLKKRVARIQVRESFIPNSRHTFSIGSSAILASSYDMSNAEHA